MQYRPPPDTDARIGVPSLRAAAGTNERRAAFLPLVGGLIAFAWLALLLWERSPYGRYLDHGRWTDIGLAAYLCHSLPAGSITFPALLYVGGWVLMIVAMMLPTTLPLLGRLGRLIEKRPDRTMLLTLVILGYFLIWGVFGLAAHSIDFLLHNLVVANPWLTFNGWIIGASVLAAAGVFQFSTLKHDCLAKCRAPFSFVNEDRGGPAMHRQAFLLGVHHGILCVGCCWATMLLMFVVGTGSVGWMLVLGALMAIEKNMSWGRRLSTPLGVGLLAWSGAIVAGGVWQSEFS
jgi:predicted metal-binding membrane protein